VLLVAGLAGSPLPLLPLQILWLNLVTDTFPALSLAFEPGESDVMERPPRDPEAAILSSGFLRAMGFYAGLITAVTLAAFYWGLAGQGSETGRAVTLSFLTLAFAQIFHLGNARSPDAVLSYARSTSNPWALGAVALAGSLQLVALYVPGLREVLGLVRPSVTEWGVVLGLATVPAVVGQGLQLWQGRRTGEG
ncbi:MAG: cation transporting ATPase C-terminal domain-containing protein, partial [Gemmatimonadota bacterium]